VKFVNTAIPGAVVIEPDRLADERGFFARTWCATEFAEHRLKIELAQCSISFNARAGTLRGMHYQTPPHEEAKLVRCTMGAIFDVIVDLRPDSAAYLKHVAVELTQENRNALYVPEGCAHGYQTLTDDTEVFYQISEYFSPEHSTGHRWNDPAFGIDWPLEVSVISERDSGYPDFVRPAAWMVQQL
jgi:dTDP-4-dehydrorhamnose 3,5-epimerase